MPRPTLTTALALAAAVACAAPAAAADKKGEPPATPVAGEAVPGEYIVLVKKEKDPKTLADEEGAKAEHVFRHALNGFAGPLTEKQLEKLRRHPQVASVEPDQVVRGGATQVMTAAGDPWGLDRIDQRFLGLSRTFTYGFTGAGVRAYVIDSGLQANHPQFGGRARNVYDAWGGTGNDCHGHGTHVAGTIGGATYGVAKGVTLLGVRVLDCANSGSIAGLIAGFDYVRATAIRPAVANASIGAPYSAALNQAATNLANAGVFVSVSAGNNAQNACSYSPASALGTLTVGSADRTDTRAYDSNYGGCVDTYAPGVGILSAYPGSTARSMNGTSMAAPHVAGTVAVAKQAFGDGYTSAQWNGWVTSNATTNVVRGNITGTPNRLLWKGTL